MQLILFANDGLLRTLARFLPDGSAFMHSHGSLELDIDTGGLPRFFNALSNVIAAYFLPEFMDRLLARDFAFLRPSHARCIKRSAVRALKLSPAYPGLISDAAVQLELCVRESGSVSAEGFFLFRMSGLKALGERLLDAEVSRLLRESEYDAMLTLLRSYTKMRAPLIDFLRIEDADGSYRLYTADGSRVFTYSRDALRYTHEESLLNSLLFLSPASLDISGIKSKDMLAVLEHVFEGRITRD